MLSPLVYAIAIPSAFVDPRVAGALYVAVAMMWFIPDRRIDLISGAGEEVQRESLEEDPLGDNTTIDRGLSGSSTWVTLPPNE